MKIGGLLKCTLIDYPGYVACTIFTIGCNYRCPGCHNKNLVIPDETTPKYTMKDILGFLYHRRKQLEGVVICGGEPTIQPDIVMFLKTVRRMGYLIKIDTNGSKPEVLKKLYSLDLLDFVAMDIKSLNTFSDPDCYRSIDLIIASKIPHLFRTTAFRPIHQTRDFSRIAFNLLAAGSRNYIVQRGIITDEVIDPSYFKESKQYIKREIDLINRDLYKGHRVYSHLII